ncbi:hypothetical protein J2S43_002844 [Catenuloplanes nepalensis]|uniref:Uncharacterized protein n=1 Tax=Catenuloplanes nepalensis TaxID=587533 RepID=A0ABT9MSB2_9ACTN|nr:hypothetical protein [Catenuloplanes nepalensis]MDP9794332.1 hypothetical protein [Catenuloplanes nepalensis]
MYGTYHLNRAGFTAVATLSETGRLESGDYYGAPLPPGLAHLSVLGRAARVDALSPGTSVLFLPAWAGIPDGAVGYAYLGDTPPGLRYDCFGDWCEAHWSLGDGWYWLQCRRRWHPVDLIPMWTVRVKRPRPSSPTAERPRRRC